MSRIQFIFAITAFLGLVAFLSNLYGTSIIEGSFTPKWSLNPIEWAKSLKTLTDLSTSFGFLNFFLAALAAAVIIMVIEIIRGA
ncbi:hypothetical protein DRN69_00340 [Candidatus Pacearchaeota archaeon]|nr:MAG: hypothetical protein DRN69_00340 [Candidatus Pacearchaeota archaeon]